MWWMTFTEKPELFAAPFIPTFNTPSAPPDEARTV
jgi:hypothetical protein